MTIKNIVVKNMIKITLIMVCIIIFLSTFIQMFSVDRENKKYAIQMFDQIEQILDENSKELKEVKKEYEHYCLNAARTVDYIIEYNPDAMNDIYELKKIANYVKVDEIHIFDKNGVIISGTHPEYIGYSFDSGEQMSFFKPLLEYNSMELVQDITPNTPEGKSVQYSAIWSDNKEFIIQVGMYPINVLRATEKNELSYIFSLLRTSVGYQLYAINADTQKVVGSTVVSDVEKSASEIGFKMDELNKGKAFHTVIGQNKYHCLSRKIDNNYILWVKPVDSLYKSIITNELLLLVALILISLILVKSVENTMNKTVIEQIKQINVNLREIQCGNLKTKVDVKNSKEFLELSDHINSMVDSLLQSSEKIEMSEKIKKQKEELEKAVKYAEEANKAKSEFLFNMSHDIRTPMNAILGFTNLALENDDVETQKEYLKNISVSGKQLLDLINNILELSRIENHKVIIQEELIDVKKTFNKLLTIFESDFSKKNLEHSVIWNIKHKYMYVDKTCYSQIFLNIMSNAVKYTSNGGKINVSFKEIEGETTNICFVETIIEDNGIGISSEFLPRIYESFSRERTSTISGIQGTGLGLTIVKNLVDLMKGTIYIESASGKGTKVTIKLPHRIEEKTEQNITEHTEIINETLLKGKRILLAEDIDINAIIATKLLTSKGCIVERAKDGVECVDMLLKSQNGYYDLILMDIQMPNMDGYKATRCIRTFEDKEKASIPILAITANAFKEDCEKAIESGMDGHISKPLDTVKMFNKITKVLIEKQKCK